MAKITATAKNLVLMALLAFGLIIFMPVPILAEATPVPDGASLIEQAKFLNGQEIVFQGEVIGDIMQRQDHYWINVLNNGTAIGVWITAEQRSMISFVGRYGTKGDMISVMGVFSQACAEHGGDLDIHADSLAVVDHGYMIQEKLNIPHLIAAVILIILAMTSLLLFVRYYRQGKRT